MSEVWTNPVGSGGQMACAEEEQDATSVTVMKYVPGGVAMVGGGVKEPPQELRVRQRSRRRARLWRLRRLVVPSVRNAKPGKGNRRTQRRMERSWKDCRLAAVAAVDVMVRLT